MSIEFKVRDFCYPVALFRLRRQFERSQWLPPDQLLCDQEQRLRQVVAQAYHQVPYYQDLFRSLKLRPEDIRTVADLHKLPTLSKATLRREFPRLQATDRRRYRPRLAQTSGSSGEPVRFLLDKPSNVLEFVYYWRHWSWAGYKLGNRFAELSSSYFLRDESRAGEVFRYQRGLGRLLLNSLAIGPDNIAAYARAVREHRPRFLKGIASALYYLALFLDEAGERDLKLGGVFSTGEMLLPYQRRVIERVFQCRVLDSYGHMERTVAISECMEGSLHINPEYGVLEMLERPSPNPVEGSERVVTADVIGTGLHNLSMPLLRYEVGDVVEGHEDPHGCPCGRAMPRVRRINGRKEDAIVTPDGRVVTTLFTVFDKVPGVAHGQVVQDEVAQLLVRIVRTRSYAPQSEETLLGYVRRFVGPGMRVRVEYVSHDALHREKSGKCRAVISRVPPPSMPSGHEG
jgi:phenylacetate-CoA ligase